MLCRKPRREENVEVLEEDMWFTLSGWRMSYFEDVA